MKEIIRNNNENLIIKADMRRVLRLQEKLKFKMSNECEKMRREDIKM